MYDNFSEVVMFEPIGESAYTDLGPFPWAPQKQGTVDLIN